VKQTYRVLLTRGMKGYYVYFKDAATKEFFLSRMLKGRARRAARNSGSKVDDLRVMSAKGRKAPLISLLFPAPNSKKTSRSRPILHASCTLPRSLAPAISEFCRSR
jgi:hypothetical protein